MPNIFTYSYFHTHQTLETYYWDSKVLIPTKNGNINIVLQVKKFHKSLDYYGTKEKFQNIIILNISMNENTILIGYNIYINFM